MTARARTKLIATRALFAPLVSATSMVAPPSGVALAGGSLSEEPLSEEPLHAAAISATSRHAAAMAARIGTASPCTTQVALKRSSLGPAAASYSAEATNAQIASKYCLRPTQRMSLCPAPGITTRSRCVPSSRS